MGTDHTNQRGNQGGRTSLMSAAVLNTEEPQSPAFAATPQAKVPGASKAPFVEGLKYGAAGGIAGAFAKSCTAPLARLTILYQVQGFSAGAAGPTGVVHPPPLRHAFLQVVRREGPAALWKGNLATILHRLPYSSINFYTYEHSNKFLQQQLPPHSDFARTLASGALAGLVACTAAYPLDLVRTRLAAQTQGHYYHGILPTLQRIVADEGAVGLYRGLGATLLQVVPSLALNFSLYDMIRNSCMAVYKKTDKQQQQQQQVFDRQAAAEHASSSSESGNETRSEVCSSEVSSGESSSSSSSSSGSRRRQSSILGARPPPDSLAHSLAVASSVDQGISHSQMLIWHLGDEAGTCGGLRRANAAAAAAEDAYTTRTASGAAASSSSGTVEQEQQQQQLVPAAGRAGEVPAGISLASGCISGFLTATATFPLDVVRRRMQVCGQQHQGEAVSYQQIIRQVLQQGGGLRGFYVGILPEYCKVVPGVAIAFCTYEQLKKWLQAE